MKFSEFLMYEAALATDGCNIVEGTSYEFYALTIELKGMPFLRIFGSTVLVFYFISPGFWFLFYFRFSGDLIVMVLVVFFREVVGSFGVELLDFNRKTNDERTYSRTHKGYIFHSKTYSIKTMTPFVFY